jgi:hypothetical protein
VEEFDEGAARWKMLECLENFKKVRRKALLFGFDGQLENNEWKQTHKGCGK